jgi:membrane fusion protein (multidrug efflux system)
MMGTKKKIFYGVVGLIVMIAAAVTVEKVFFPKPSTILNIPMTIVKVSHPKNENVPFEVSALGQIKSAQEIDLMAQQSGYLTAVNVQSGDQVEKGQLLFQIANKTQAAAVASARAGLTQAKAHYDRIETLVKEGAASQDELDTQDKNLQQSKAMLDQAEKAYSETQVSAPFSGQVTATDLAVGSYVNVGDTLIGIVSGKEKFVQYVLPSGYLKFAKLGQSVSFNNPFEKTQAVSAKVSYVSPEIDIQSASFVVKAAIPSSLAEALPPGLTVMVAQVLQADRKVLALPSLSIKADPNGFYVFLIEPQASATDEGRIVMRRIKIGSKFGEWVEILSGLSTSDAVVVEGQEKVHEGQRVKYGFI